MAEIEGYSQVNPVEVPTYTGGSSSSTSSTASTDTMTKSQQEQDAEKVNAAIPVLTNPMIGFLQLQQARISAIESAGATSSACHALALEQQRLCLAFVSAWLDNVKEVADKAREKDRADAIEHNKIQADIRQQQILQEDVVNRIHHATLAPQASAFLAGYVETVGNLSQRASTIEDVQALNGLVAGFTIGIVAGAAGVKEAIMAGGIDSPLVAVNAVLDASPQVTPIFDAASIAAMTINLMVPVALATLGAEALKAGGAPQINLKLAKELVGKLIGIITEHQVFNDLIKAAFVNLLPRGTPINPKQLATFIAQVKAWMLLMAMALLYKVQTGGVSGKEIRDILSGDLKLPFGEGGAEDLISQIRDLLKGKDLLTEKDLLEGGSSLGKSGAIFSELDDGGESLVAAFSSFLDKGPSLDALASPVKNMEKMLDLVSQYVEPAASDTPA